METESTHMPHKAFPHGDPTCRHCCDGTCWAIEGDPDYSCCGVAACPNGADINNTRTIWVRFDEPGGTTEQEITGDYRKQERRLLALEGWVARAIKLLTVLQNDVCRCDLSGEHACETCVASNLVSEYESGLGC